MAATNEACDEWCWVFWPDISSGTHDSCVSVVSLVHTCNITRICVCHDSCICATWIIHTASFLDSRQISRRCLDLLHSVGRTLRSSSPRTAGTENFLSPRPEYHSHPFDKQYCSSCVCLKIISMEFIDIHNNLDWAAVTILCASGQHWFNQSACVIIIYVSSPRFWSQYLHARHSSYTTPLFPRWVAAFRESWLEKSSSCSKKTSSQNLNFNRTRNSRGAWRLWCTVSMLWIVMITVHVCFEFCK